MLSASRPCSSASATAACSTRSRVSGSRGVRGVALGIASVEGGLTYLRCMYSLSSRNLHCQSHRRDLLRRDARRREGGATVTTSLSHPSDRSAETAAPPSPTLPLSTPALVHERYGESGALRLGEVELAPLEPDQVLVEVRATSVNPADWYGVTGFLPARLGNGLRTPQSPFAGTDLAGRVIARRRRRCRASRSAMTCSARAPGRGRTTRSRGSRSSRASRRASRSRRPRPRRSRR